MSERGWGRTTKGVRIPLCPHCARRTRPVCIQNASSHVTSDFAAYKRVWDRWKSPYQASSLNVSTANRRCLNSAHALSTRRRLVLHMAVFFRTAVTLAIILRGALVIYGAYQDGYSTLKYTDIDYRVFSDAARIMLQPAPEQRAKGWLVEWLGWGIGELSHAIFHVLSCC